MVVFDMDNTLLLRRFIDVCAEEFKFTQALGLLRQIDKDPVNLTVRIAGLLRGRSKNELVELASSIPLVEDIVDVIGVLKSRGYLIGIISDSYQLITQYIASKIGADFSLGNELQFEGDLVSGDVLIPSYFHYAKESTCKHQVCKTNALRYIAEKYNVPLEKCVVVGDSENDICIVKHAGLGVSFCTTNELLKRVASKHINEKSFSELLEYIKPVMV